MGTYKARKKFTYFPFEQAIRHKKRSMLLLSVSLFSIILLIASGCAQQNTPPMESFTVPIENRLITNVPYFPDETSAYSQAGLAALLAYYGHPQAMEDMKANFKNRPLPARRMASYARAAGFKAEYGSSTPNELLKELRQDRPVLVRLGLDAPPLQKGIYAVVMGFNQMGLVVNSSGVNQEIINWSDFLAAWYADSNFIFKISPDKINKADKRQKSKNTETDLGYTAKPSSKDEKNHQAQAINKKENLSFEPPKQTKPLFAPIGNYDD